MSQHVPVPVRVRMGLCCAGFGRWDTAPRPRASSSAAVSVCGVSAMVRQHVRCEPPLLAVVCWLPLPPGVCARLRLGHVHVVHVTSYPSGIPFSYGVPCALWVHFVLLCRIHTQRHGQHAQQHAHTHSHASVSASALCVCDAAVLCGRCCAVVFVFLSFVVGLWQRQTLLFVRLRTYT
jgi:hypothetical protein